MHAVEIVKEFHTLSPEERVDALAGVGPLAKEIAELPDVERAGVKKAIAQDFDSSGKFIAKGELSADKKAVEVASEVEPEPEAATKDSASGVPVASDPGDKAPADLGANTVAELREIAAEKGVDLTGLTKKADILAAIEAKE